MAPVIGRRYDLLRSCWKRESNIEIRIVGPEVTFQIPLAFMRETEIDCWGTIVALLELVVAGKGCLIHEGTQAVLAEQEQTDAGRFLYVPEAVHDNFTWRRGPESDKIKAAKEQGKGDGRSSLNTDQRTQSSTDALQRSLRFGVATRDQVCLISGEGEETNLQAAHIVPKSRPDVYRRIIGVNFVDPFEKSHGLLLEKTLHSDYDQYKWSLFPKDGNLHVLVWDQKRTQGRRFHGQVITDDRWSRFVKEEDKPDQRLCAWHNAQCAMMYLRGFAVDMNVSE